MIWTYLSARCLYTLPHCFAPLTISNNSFFPHFFLSLLSFSNSHFLLLSNVHDKLPFKAKFTNRKFYPINPIFHVVKNRTMLCLLCVRKHIHVRTHFSNIVSANIHIVHLHTYNTHTHLSIKCSIQNIFKNIFFRFLTILCTFST